MYRTDDKKAAIREVQKYLYALAISEDYEMPEVIPDGIFGERTREDVLLFQRQNGLNETGAVDHATFDALYREYCRVCRPTRGRRTFPSEKEYPMRKGQSGTEIENLHAILTELSRYDPLLPLLRGDTFTEHTESAVRRMQKNTGMPETGEVDADFFDRLCREIHARKEAEKCREMT